MSIARVVALDVFAWVYAGLLASCDVAGDRLRRRKKDRHRANNSHAVQSVETLRRN